MHELMYWCLGTVVVVFDVGAQHVLPQLELYFTLAVTSQGMGSMEPHNR